MHASVRIYTPVTIGADGILYYGTGDGQHISVNPDGTRRWTLQSGAGWNKQRSTPVIAADGTVFFGSSSGQLYALADLP